MLYKALYKWLAVLLCASLCASGPVVNVIAASDSFEPKTENEQTISTEFSDSDRSETNETISTEVPETKEGTAEFSESEENSSTEGKFDSNATIQMHTISVCIQPPPSISQTKGFQRARNLQN